MGEKECTPLRNDATGLQSLGFVQHANAWHFRASACSRCLSKLFAKYNNNGPISIAPYLTDKGEHTGLYSIRYTVYRQASRKYKNVNNGDRP